MSAEQELKPCPFCGSPAVVSVDCDHHGEYFSLGCAVPECLGHWALYTEPIKGLRRAVERWNRRAGDSA